MHAASSHFWARFQQVKGQRLRFDTRVYLSPCTQPEAQDQALGCIIGKNPGSAGPVRRSRSLVPLALDGDKFLPTVLSILSKAHAAGNCAPPQNAYIQVLNLFYLCDRDLPSAKRALKASARPRPCDSEKFEFPWAWFAWGGADPTLDPLKTRFATLAARRPFFFDGHRREVVERRPRSDELAKHTQGLPQAGLVDFLAKTVI